MNDGVIHEEAVVGVDSQARATATMMVDLLGSHGEGAEERVIAFNDEVMARKKMGPSTIGARHVLGVTGFG